MAAVEKFTFLDEVGIQGLSEALFGKVNIRIAERIVQELNESSDAKHVPSAIIVKQLLEAQKTATDTAIGGINTKLTAVEGKADANTTAIGAVDTKIDTVKADLTALGNTVAGLTHLTIDTVTGPINDVAEPNPGVLYLQRDNESDKTWILYIYRPAVMEGETVVTPAAWIAIGDTSVDLVGYWKKTDVDEMREALSIPDVEAMTAAQITTAVEAAFTSTEVFTPAP